jgi:FkbM family methyltransferase
MRGAYHGEPPQSPAHLQWEGAGGETLVLTFDGLSPSSFVVDVGAYRGKWVAEIFTRYQCTVAAIEPVPRFADEIAAKYAPNPKIQVHNIALGARTETRSMSLMGDASSAVLDGPDQTEVRFIDVADWMKEHAPSGVDLMSINCEGGEYDILPRLIETGAISNIRQLMVQFHNFSEHDKDSRERIRKALSKTHTQRYEYPFVWECWQITASGLSAHF